MEYDEAALQAVREKRLIIDQYDKWIFDEISSSLGNRIVEIGCGLGNQIAHLITRELVIGIDTSDESVRAIREKYSAYKNIEAFKLSVTEPDFLEFKNKSIVPYSQE